MKNFIQRESLFLRKEAKQELRKEAGRLSLQHAEEMIRGAINDEDQTRLRNDYISQITQ
jgi:F0F1-type ATP synthase membrane subunit b/b'